MTKVLLDGKQDRTCSSKVIYLSPCVVAYDVSVDEFEQMYEVTAWPHHEIEEEDDCVFLHHALQSIGAWALFAVPVATFEDLSGAMTWTLIPLS